jgi:hypothetical protein
MLSVVKVDALARQLANAYEHAICRGCKGHVEEHDAPPGRCRPVATALTEDWRGKTQAGGILGWTAWSLCWSRQRRRRGPEHVWSTFGSGSRHSGRPEPLYRSPSMRHPHSRRAALQIGSPAEHNGATPGFTWRF